MATPENSVSADFKRRMPPVWVHRGAPQRRSRQKDRRVGATRRVAPTYSRSVLAKGQVDRIAVRPLTPVVNEDVPSTIGIPAHQVAGIGFKQYISAV